MPNQQRFEGAVLEDLLDEVRSRFGDDVDIVEANKVRKGGVGGFFAREAFEVVVELDEDTDRGYTDEDDDPSTDRSVGAVHGRTLLDLVDAVDDGPAPLASPDTVAALLARTAEPPLPDVAPRTATEASVETLLERLSEARARGVAPVRPTETALSTDGETFADILGRIAHDTRTADVDDETPFRSYADDARAEARTRIVPEPTPAVIVDEVPAPTPIAEDLEVVTATPARTAPRGMRPEPCGAPAPGAGGLLDLTRLARLGLPESVLARPVSAVDRISGLLELADTFPRARRLPTTGDAVIALVGDRSGMERAVAWIHEELGLSPELLMLATRSEGRVFPEQRRIGGHDDAADHRRAWRRRRQPTLVVIDDEVGIRGTAWARHVLDALEPSAVWGVVDAQRKPEDVVEWSERIGGIDAVALDGTGETSSPASILTTGLPVSLLDGASATPARWAAVLDERMLAA